MPDLPHLAPGAIVNEDALKAIYAVANQRQLWTLSSRLRQLDGTRGFDAALWLAQETVWDNLEAHIAGDPSGLISFAWSYYEPGRQRIIAQRLLKDRDVSTRRSATRLFNHTLTTGEVPDHAGKPWDWMGWTQRSQPGRLGRHPSGTRVQAKAGVPPIQDVAALRELLHIGSPNQLGYMLLASEGPYFSFTIPKSDGTPRAIHAPKRQLRVVQRQILRQILDAVPTHDAAHGFVKGRSTVTNAAPHVGRPLLVKFDLKDFFPTITYWRVVGLFASLGYGTGDLRFSKDDESRAIAPTLARLCTWTDDEQWFGEGALPQGAPTSPAISNLICRRLDSRLSGLAEAMGGTYTRYADDMTFSFAEEPDRGVGRLRWWVEELCRQEGFAIHPDKFKVRRSSQRQQVTGVVVNDSLRVPRSERRRFRAILSNCRNTSVAEQARGREVGAFGDYLRGFAAYVRMVHPEEGERLLAEVDALLGKESTP